MGRGLKGAAALRASVPAKRAASKAEHIPQKTNREPNEVGRGLKGAAALRAKRSRLRGRVQSWAVSDVVEHRGVEPLTSRLRTWRSTN